MEINSFRDSFERGEDPLADASDASDINSAAGVLKLYLRELREPLFPSPYFDQFMEIAREWAQWWRMSVWWRVGRVLCNGFRLYMVSFLCC